jgi:hypothetical protein
MATWTNVSNTVLEPGDPIRSVDIIAIKENVIALSEGASGAPKIVTAAINDAAVTTAKLATNERITTANVLAATAGASAGAVGTYCTAVNTTNNIPIGSTTAGSSLRGINTAGAYASPGFGGTWRNMGASSGTGLQSIGSSSLWLRIS